MRVAHLSVCICTCFTCFVIRLYILFPDNFAMGKDLEICLTSTKDLQHGQRNDFSTKLAGTRQNNLLETGSCKCDEKIDKGKLNLNR